jgi:hypothetical protein
MNRTLRRPMFRIGGPTSEGITSGLDRPRMANADMDMKIKQITQAYESYRQQGGTLSFEDFSKLYAEENFNSGGRVGFQTGGFNFGGLPGFAISTGLDLLSRPPQGGLLSTVAGAAREPFNRLRAEQAAATQTASDRAFQRELLGEELKGKMDIAKLKQKDQFFAAQTPEEQFRERLKVYGESRIPPIRDNATDLANFEVKNRSENYVQLDFIYNNKTKGYEPDFRGIPDGALTYNPIDGLAYKNEGGNFIKLNPFTLEPLEDADGSES